MADNNEATNFATAGSGKSPAEVAFELVSKLKGQGVWGERNMPEILDMYAECLDAANGLRSYPGQNRVDAPVTESVSSPAEQPAPVQQAAAEQPPAAPLQNPSHEQASMHDIAQALHTQPGAAAPTAEAPPMQNPTYNSIG